MLRHPQQLCLWSRRGFASPQSALSSYLLPSKQDAEVTDRLRSVNKYPIVRARTNRYKNSFVLYGLSNLQRSAIIVLMCVCLTVVYYHYPRRARSASAWILF